MAKPMLTLQLHYPVVQFLTMFSTYTYDNLAKTYYDYSQLG